MSLNISTGNMYDFISHTYNTVKGECPHGCTYCYMKRWGQQKPVRFVESELKTDLGSGNFIFVGSSCDLFAKDIPEEWIRKTLKYCESFNNRYLFQSKNPVRILDYIDSTVISDKSVVCTTIETNREYPKIMKNSPSVIDRVFAMNEISQVVSTYVTIEPVLAFDFYEMVQMIRDCHPKQVNIGADSGNNNLPEPKKTELIALIYELQNFTIINRKTNLSRILNK